MKKKLIAARPLWKRILTGAVLMLWLPSAFSAVQVFADTTTEPAVTTNPDEYGDLNYNGTTTATTAAATDGNGNPIGDSNIKISENGKTLQVETESDQPWDEENVTGDEQPTLNALSVAEYMQKIGTTKSYPIEDSEHLYTLSVSTGIKAGDSVEYFAIRYTDVKGSKQTKYMFPKSYSLQAANDYINGLRKDDVHKDEIVGYHINYYDRAESDGKGKFIRETYYAKTYVTQNNISTETVHDYNRNYRYDYFVVDDAEAAKQAVLDRHRELYYNSEKVGRSKRYDNIDGRAKIQTDNVIKESWTYTTVANINTIRETHNVMYYTLGYEINPPSQTTKALQQWSTEEFLFKTEEDISTVDQIEVFMSNGDWTVQGLSISKVTSVNGYGEYGFYSGKYFLSLGKQYLYELESRNGGHAQLHATTDTLHLLAGENSDYYRLLPSSKKDTVTNPEDEYYSFRIDIADELQSGLESLAETTVGKTFANIQAVEDLAIEIEYLDKNGWTRGVSMPVLLSMLGQASVIGDKVRTMGPAQRGDTLAFTARLPEFEKLLTVKLHTGAAARNSIAAGGIVPRKQFKAEKNALGTKLDSDFISIAGISFYKGTCRASNYAQGRDQKTNQQLDCYSYGFSFSSPEPLAYFTTIIPTGYRVKANSTAKFDMAEYTQGSLVTAPSMGNFIIRLRTDEVNRVIKNCNLNVSISYQDYSGNQKTSKLYNVKDEVMNYLGYWPTVSEPLGNFGYLYGLMPGRYIEFPVTLEDAAAILNIAISTDMISDEIQIAGISVSVVDEIGKRRIYAQTLEGAGGASNFRIVRTLKHTVIPPFPITLKLLFTPGKSFNITTGTGTVIPAGEPDYSTMRYSMSYDDTKRDLGFIRDSITYDITVKVANDATKSNVNGDSGSKNQFYFQLLFKNGKSAFVLANQQLTSDGFRSGMEEMFSIKINRNYGDVTSIRIIPEDISSDSDVFDKLNVDKITVTERTNGGAGMQYVFNTVGWIGIDYHDSGEQTTYRTKTGRLLVELAKTYTVSYQQKVIYLYCEIGAWPWDIPFSPFEASIGADLTYLDINDQPQTVSFDVVSRMYSYMNRTPKAYEGASDGSEQALYNSMGTISDPDFMLRPNHVDCFVLPPLADAKTIKSMTLYIVNRTNGTKYWVISDVTLSRIYSDSGTVVLKRNGDHESDYKRNMETADLCKMVFDNKTMENQGMNIELPVGQKVSRTIKFSDSSITWSENSSWTSAVTRMPESSNDTLNLYLYPTDYNKNIDASPVSAVLQYSLPFSRVMQVKQNRLNTVSSGTKDAMYYFKGISATDMQNLLSIGITCRDSEMMFKRAIVEQVRDNVIVNRYEIPLGGSSATLGLRASPSKNSIQEGKKRQNMMISFSDLTKEMTLFGPNEDYQDVNDIAVAFQYRTTIDKNLPVDFQQKYYTPYVYLTDVGIQKLRPGLMAEIPFEIPFVAEITGYKIVSFGNIVAEVNSAMIVNYNPVSAENQDGGSADIMEHCYGIRAKFPVENSITEKFVVPDALADQMKGEMGMSGQDSVAPLELTLRTAPAKAGGATSVNVPVTMNIYYRSVRDKRWTFTIPDIRTYIEPKLKTDPDTGESIVVDNLVAGESATIKLLLPDCYELEAFAFQLQDETGAESWNLESISYRFKLENTPYPRPVNMEFSNVLKSFSVRKVNLASDVFLNGVWKDKVSAAEYSLRAEGGQQIEIRPTVEKGENGYGYKVLWVQDASADVDVTAEDVRPTENGFVFTPKVNSSVTTDTYKIIVYANDNTDRQNIIYVKVPSSRTDIGQTTVETTTTSTPAQPLPGQTDQTTTALPIV